MKFKCFFAAAAAALIGMVSCGNKDPKVDVEYPTQSKIDSVSYLVGINFGYFIKMNGFGDRLNYAEVKKGMMDFINAKGNPRDESFNKQFKIDPEEMNRLFEEFTTQVRAYTGAVNKVKGEEFIAEKFKEPGTEKSESGLAYKIHNSGNDLRASEQDTVWVNYTGTLIDGTEFDSNKKQGEPVMMFRRYVVPGFGEGLGLVGEGGHITLYIPGELAYGEYGTSGIESNSTLVFDVEVTKIGKFVEPEPEDQAEKSK